MKLQWDVWLRGLAAAFISAAASGVTAGMTAMGVDPEHFNLSVGLAAVLKMAGVVAFVGGIVGAANYLKQSPVPEWDGSERRGNGSPITAILLILALGFGMTACGGGYGGKRVAHPGEIDAFDGSTYDVLLSFQAGLDQAKRELASGTLAASHKGFVNVAGTGYSVLREAWLGYRAVKLLPDCTPGQTPVGCKTGSQLKDAVAKVNAALPAAHNFIAQLRALFSDGTAPDLLQFEPL